MSPVEQLALRTAPAESLLTWLTKLTGPHLVEAVLTSESHTALAILVTPEVLYDPNSPRVGLGLVYKAPYIKTASFSEAFFYLKSASEDEVDKRITDSHLIFVQINEASKVIPLPYVQPLFLDVPTTSDVTDSNKPKSPHAFRAFRLHRVIYMEGSTLTTQVAFPCLGGKTKSHLLNFQKQLLIPELHEQPLLSVALAVADDEHWNIANDPEAMKPFDNISLRMIFKCILEALESQPVHLVTFTCVSIQLVWQSSGRDMKLLKPLKQTSLSRSQAQEEEVPHLQ